MTLAVAADPIPLQTTADGALRIGVTRVTLDTVVEAFLDGATAEEIVQQYPSLQLEDVYSVLGYYLRRRAEVDSYLEKRQQFAATVRQENETQHDPAGVRARLLARKPQGG